MTRDILQDMNNVIKLGKMMQHLAHIELEKGVILHTKIIQAALAGAGIMGTITRRDINLHKLLLLNEEYQSLISEIDRLCDLPATNDSVELQDRLIEICNKKDALYSVIESSLK